LRNGERCRSVAVDGSEFYVPHRELAADVGEHALRAGRYPRRGRQDSALVHVVDAAQLVKRNAPARTAAGTVTPSDVRTLPQSLRTSPSSSAYCSMRRPARPGRRFKS
jgi:hypothetical protein